MNKKEIIKYLKKDDNFKSLEDYSIFIDEYNTYFVEIEKFVLKQTDIMELLSGNYNLDNYYSDLMEDKKVNNEYLSMLDDYDIKTLKEFYSEIN